MAEIIKIKDVDKEYIVNSIKNGSILIYPTDTVYSIGCDAKNSKSIQRLKKILKKNKQPFSIIAPSKTWILNNFKVKKSYINKLPGPFTYKIKTKKRSVVDKEIKEDALYVRIPEHPFIKIIQKSKRPFIIVTINEKKSLTQIKKIPSRIIKKVDIVIDGEELDNKPFTVIDFTQDFPRILK